MSTSQATLQEPSFDWAATKVLAQVLVPPRASRARRLASAAALARCGASTKMVDWLASEIAKLEKRGVAAPFIFTDMKHWLPEWLEAARVNVNDDPALRAERLEKFRESLADHKIHLRSGKTTTG